jgi:hypothetical protein
MGFWASGFVCRVLMVLRGRFRRLAGLSWPFVAPVEGVTGGVRRVQLDRLGRRWRGWRRRTWAEGADAGDPRAARRVGCGTACAAEARGAAAGEARAGSAAASTWGPWRVWRAVWRIGPAAVPVAARGSRAVRGSPGPQRGSRVGAWPAGSWGAVRRVRRKTSGTRSPISSPSSRSGCRPWRIRCRSSARCSGARRPLRRTPRGPRTRRRPRRSLSG